jgi:hypothetical protein
MLRGRKDGDWALSHQPSLTAGPLLSSQPPRPQTTQPSRSLGDPRHPNEHLWSVAGAAARRRRCPPSDRPRPTDLSDTADFLGVDRYAVAVGQPLEGSIDGSTARTRLEACPGGGPNRLGTDAYAAERCFTQRASRPPGSGVGPGSGVARCRRDAAPLLSCGLESGPEVWRGIRRLLLECGEQAPAVSGTKSSSHTRKGCQTATPSSSMLHSVPARLATEQ